jgi:HSP20 family protein
MLSRHGYGDFDRSFWLFDELRRRMDRVWDELDGDVAARPAPLSGSGFPRVNLFDDGNNLLVQADVPGLSESDIQVTLQEGTLHLRGARKLKAPEGYAVQRQERSSYEFSRSIALPFAVDAEKCTAAVKDGMLTVTMARAPEARPRTIAVRAQ